MNISRILALASRIIHQILRDRRTLALIFVVPIVVMTLLYLVLTNGTTVHTVALVWPTGTGSDRVNTVIRTLLPGKDKLNVISIHADQVDSTLKDGNADAALVFPANFAQQVFAGQKPAVEIVLEGSDPSVASALRDQLTGLTHQLGLVLSTLQQGQTSGTGQGSHPGQGAAPGQGPLPSPVSSNAQLFTVSSPRYLYGGSEYTYNDSLAPVFIGVFSFFFVFLLTSVAFLRERTQGTIERVMVSPLRRPELVIGYVCGFTVFALVQSLLTLLFVVFALKVHYRGNLALVFLIAALLTIGSVNLGIFLSTFARNEFQVVQFIPLVFGIQIFLSGLFWPIAQLPRALQLVSYVLPLTYANDALRSVMIKGDTLSGISSQLIALLVFACLMVVLSALTIRREIA